MIQIPNVAEETKEKIKRSSAYSLPNNPTGAGYKPQDIKNALFKPIVDGQYSVLAEIDKLINELNKVLPSVKISEMKLNGKDNTLQLLDENMQKIASIDLPFVNRIEKTSGEYAYAIINGEQTTKRISPTVVAGAIVSRDPDGRTAFKDPISSNEAVTKGYFENNVISSFSYEMSDDYKIKLMLKNKNDKTIGEVEIDLPIESMIVNASYSSGYLRLELQNGNTLDVDVSNIIRGLVNENDFDQKTTALETRADQLEKDIIEIGQETSYHISEFEQKVIALEKQIPVLEQELGNTNINVGLLEESKQDKLTIEQQVNDSEKPVSSKAVKAEFNLFSNAYDDRFEQLTVSQRDFGNGDTIVLENNKDYHANDKISNLNIVIPDGNILCSLMFTTVGKDENGKDLPIKIDITGCKGYIGKAPDLEVNDVTWELSIHNGIIASGKVVSE